MQDRPEFTLVTVCLNSEKTIRTTIESVLSQTFRDYEYIIKDGGSSDGTLGIAEEYVEAFGGRLRVISEKDGGIYEAMNQGVAAASGKMIGIINSDDYYSPDTLEKVYEVCGKNADTDLLVVIGDMERVTADGEVIYHYRFDDSMVERKECFGHPSMFAAKAVYDRIGLYDTTYKLAADGDWQFRAMEDEQVRVVLCPHVLNHMREGGASDLRKYRWKWFSERSRMRLAHSKGSAAKIYGTELKKVIVCDVKSLLPEKAKGRLYRYRYRKNTKRRGE